MSLRERERAAARVCFDAVPSDEDLALLGSVERWRDYRSMVRARLTRVVGAAMPRLVAALGTERFEHACTEWLAAAPPTERYFRHVPEGFLAQQQSAFDADTKSPWLGELARFELMAWRILHVDDRDVPPVGPLSFERPIVMNPALEMIDLRYDVQPHADPHRDAYEKKPLHLLMYRSAEFKAITLLLNPLARDLVVAWTDPANADQTLAALTQEVAKRRDTRTGPKFIESLATLLEDYLGRGIVLGSRSDSVPSP